MGLRLTEGVDAFAIAERFGLNSVVEWGRVDRLHASGHLRRDGGKIALTAKGRLLLDHILGEIAAIQPTNAATPPESVEASQLLVQLEPPLAVRAVHYS